MFMGLVYQPITDLSASSIWLVIVFCTSSSLDLTRDLNLLIASSAVKQAVSGDCSIDSRNLPLKSTMGLALEGQ